MRAIKGKENLKRHYARADVADKYESVRFADINGRLKHALETDIIRRLLKRYRPSDVLELAIGPGRMTKELVKIKKVKLIGADYSLAMLREARKVVHSCRLIQADAFHLPFKDNSFDCVITLRFIRHLQPEERRKVYKETSRVLRPGGLLIFDVCNAVRHSRQIATRKVYDELYTKRSLKEEMAKAKLPMTKFYSYLHGLEALFRLGILQGALFSSVRWTEKSMLQRLHLFDRLGYLWMIAARNKK